MPLTAGIRTLRAEATQAELRAARTVGVPYMAGSSRKWHLHLFNPWDVHPQHSLGDRDMSTWTGDPKEWSAPRRICSWRCCGVQSIREPFVSLTVLLWSQIQFIFKCSKEDPEHHHRPGPRCPSRPQIPSLRLLALISTSESGRSWDRFLLG